MAERMSRPGCGEGAITIRPWVAAWICWVCAVASVGVFVAIAVVLPDVQTGVYFRFADQVAMVLIGVLLAAGVLLFQRPRVRADVEGIEIRNIGVTRYVPWSQVRGVSFPDGASWARVDLPDDEYVPVMAIQAVDRGRAVEAIRAVRALHRDGLARARASSPRTD